MNRPRRATTASTSRPPARPRQRARSALRPATSCIKAGVEQVARRPPDRDRAAQADRLRQRHDQRSARATAQVTVRHVAAAPAVDVVRRQRGQARHRRPRQPAARRRPRSRPAPTLVDGHAPPAARPRPCSMTPRSRSAAGTNTDRLRRRRACAGGTVHGDRARSSTSARSERSRRHTRLAAARPNDWPGLGACSGYRWRVHGERPREADARRHRAPSGASVGRPTAPTASTGPTPASRGLLDRHAAADGVRLAPRRPRVQLHPHRHRRPLPAHAGQERLLPDGLGRQRPAHRAPGPELLRRPLRPVAALRPRLRRRPTSAGKEPLPISRPQLRRAVRAAHRRATSRPSRSCGAASACPSTGATLHHHRRPLPRAPARSAFLRNLARGEAYQQEAPTLWDVDFRTAVAQAELEDREIPGAYHRLRLPPRRRRRRPASSTPPGPSCSPSCVALVAHPDDERYQPLFGHDGPHAAVRRRGPDRRPPRWPTPRRAPGIAMICTFGDITDVTWWRELQLPDARRRRPRRPHRRGRRPTGSPTDDGRAALRRAGRQDGEAGPAPASSSCSREIGRAARRAPADHPPGQVLREGRPPARDRHQPPVVHPQRRPRPGAARGASSSGAGSSPGIPTTCATATRTGSAASTATG